MDIYESFQQVSMWGDNFKVDGSLNSIASPMLLVNTTIENKPEYIPHEPREPSGTDQETTNKDVSKVLRRLAQNREAARKSRLRKKAYVQQLETSRLKLMQLELDIMKARKQGLYIGNALDASYMGSSETINPGIVAFEIEYGHWVEEQQRQNEELRNAFQTHASDVQLRLLVQSTLNHYSNLFRMKADAAKVDVLYLISGVWKASVERIFLWIGGSRPSQLLNLIVPQLEPLTEPQIVSINKLRQSSQQAEDALSQGLEKLQQSLVNDMAVDPMSVGNFGIQMSIAIEKFEALESFVSQGSVSPNRFENHRETMSNLRTLCRPHTVFSFISCRHQFRFRASFRNPNCKPRLPSPSLYSTWLGSNCTVPWFRVNQRRTVAKASSWDEQKSPYETLGKEDNRYGNFLCILVLTVSSSIVYAETIELERDADEEQIKNAYRRLAKFYHPDVYDGRGTLEEGETAEARFIKIQAAYELLIDEEKRRQYDMDNRVNPMKASQAWMEWLIKKRKAFDQRGHMAIAAWAEQQQRELNLRVRQLSRSKIDPDEARKILAREKKASAENFSNTLKRHTLILKKRDLMRRKAEEEKKKIISQLLAAEGLELDSESDDAM
ncbi:hypothetical protein SESBI_24767 [Sesbania bispinosa]|nr:hypothetical protein SESBI_24767 [Sesbania bispinosa]